MRNRIHSVTTQIISIRDDENNIKIITLADPEGWPLPGFIGGSHLDIYLQSGRIRQYSLCSDPENIFQYVIAVQEEKDGRGGSSEMHSLKEGMIVPVSLPRNQFSLADSTRHIFVAGGIGITPFLSMIPKLISQKVDWELHICAKSEAKIACQSLLKLYEGNINIRKHLSQNGMRLSIKDIIASIKSDEHLYFCGPVSMIDEAVANGTVLGDRLHFEKFGIDENLDDAAYEVVLKKSGRVIQVPKGQTMLGALRFADVDVPASCEGGICLECKTRFFEGTPIHRDLVMKPGDRKSFITPCVSTCASERLELDL
jgi:ferredoxin-NADP reductase